jgi:hypothetical protein
MSVRVSVSVHGAVNSVNDLGSILIHNLSDILLGSSVLLSSTLAVSADIEVNEQEEIRSEERAAEDSGTFFSSAVSRTWEPWVVGGCEVRVGLRGIQSQQDSSAV